MKLVVENVSTKVEGLDKPDEDWLREELTFMPDTYTPKPKPLRMLKRGKIPSGLVPRVLRMAKDHGLEVEVEDKRVHPCPVEEAVRILGTWGDADSELGWLRDYQRDAVDRVVTRRRGILSVPTGGGKTEIAIGMTLVYPCRWLFLAHRTMLTEQAKDRFELRSEQGDLAVEAAVWGKEQGGERLTVATFQTLWSRMKADRKGTVKRLSAFDGLIVDECHTLPAESFYSVAMACKGAYYRFGLSGTPARGYKSDVLSEAALGPLIFRLPPSLLVGLGHLSQPTIRLIGCHQSAEYQRWQTGYRNLIVRSKVRNRLVVEAVKAAEKSCLVFVQQMEHGKTLRDLLAKEGLSVEFADGGWSTPKRKAAAERLNRHDLDVLITTKIFQEGVDIPYLMSVVNAAGGQSVVQVVQQQGRAMRAAAGKTTCEIWDFDDTGNKWLRAHARKREKLYRSQGFAPKFWSPQLTLPSAAAGV